MSSRAAAVLLIGGICLLAASIPRSHSRARAPHRAHATERPWLTRDAQDELIGANGVPGPLFAGVTLGGPAPSSEQRAAIAQFANRHGIDIRLEVHDDTLVAIRASITFGGCCGYEAVDMIGRRTARPYFYPCCDCGEGNPVDDWAFEPEAGVHARFHTHVNTLTVRWEPALSTPDVLDAVEDLVGRPIDRVVRAEADRLREVLPHEYMLELPYDPQYPQEGAPRFGASLASHAGVVSEISLEVRLDEPATGEQLGSEDRDAALQTLLRARWGRPRVDAESGDWTWHARDRVITAVFAYDGRANVTMTYTGETRLASRQ